MDTTRHLYKVCDNERQARDFQKDQEDRLRNRNLHRLFVVVAEPLNRTRDNYINTSGPWGVYLQHVIDGNEPPREEGSKR